jgi:hypothetical protein
MTFGAGRFAGGASELWDGSVLVASKPFPCQKPAQEVYESCAVVLAAFFIVGVGLGRFVTRLVMFAGGLHFELSVKGLWARLHVAMAEWVSPKQDRLQGRSLQTTAPAPNKVRTQSICGLSHRGRRRRHGAKGHRACDCPSRIRLGPVLPQCPPKSPRGEQ